MTDEVVHYSIVETFNIAPKHRAMREVACGIDIPRAQFAGRAHTMLSRVTCTDCRPGAREQEPIDLRAE